MKKILGFVIFIGVALSLFGYDVFSNTPLSGNAKTCTCTEYAISTKFGDYFRTPSYKIVYTYDENGKEVETADYTPRDVLIGKIQNTYDSNGNLTVLSGLNANGELIWKTINTYKNGLIVDSSEYDKANNLRGKTICTYKDDLKTEETGYDANGALTWKTVYSYNDAKQLVKRSQYFANGTLDEEEIYTYLENGTIDTIITFSSITDRKQEVFRYASNGLLSEITTYGADTKISKRLLIKYDKEDNVAKISDYAISEKFGTTVNELIYMAEYNYTY